MRLTRRSAYSTAVIAGLAGLASGVAGAFAARQISGPARPWPGYAFTPFEVGADSEDVTFAAADGARIAGWWLDRPDSDLVVICCHGHRGSKADLLGIGPGLWRAGNTVLMFDFRGNGDSSDGFQSLAHYEQRDLSAAIDYVARRRPDARIAVVGFSMGAAVTIMVAVDDPRVDLIVLDSPFAEMRDVIATAMRRLKVPTFPTLAASEQVTRMLYGYRFAEVRPIEAIARLSPRPVLLLHGEEDRIIPISHARRLFDAARQPKQLVTFPGADHCGGYFTDRAGYIDLVAGFLADGSLPPAGER